MTDFNKNLDLLNPTLFVNDINVNAPLAQLLQNDEYILKFLNGNRMVLKSFFGNLLDFNSTGEKILSNAGRFDSYKKCNTWKALKNFAINNDEDIIFDSTDANTSETFAYKGYCDTATCLPSYNVNRESWIEREVYVPEILRGQQLVLAIKAASSPTTDNWNKTTSLSMATSGYETIAVEILNGEQTIREYKVVGPWELHNTYEHVSSVPEMMTTYFTFRTKPSTKSVKIKIFRTINSDYLHINKMFLGALTVPYDNDTEVYEPKDIDISNFYDFDNDVAKITATSVAGHKLPMLSETPKQNDLLLMYHMYDEIRKNMTTRSNLSGVPDNTKPEYGVINLNTANVIYTVTHHPINAGESYPQVTLVTPNSSANFFIKGVFDIQTSQFSIFLSALPDSNNYKINWFIPTIETSDIIDEWTVSSHTPPAPVIYPDIFDYENDF